MINPEVKAKWLAALRSGEFAQGTGKLRDDEGFCCLGVLCMVADPSLINTNGFAHVEKDGKTIYDYIEDWTGIQAWDIYNLNDTHRLSFSEIADWLEKAI